MILLSFLAISQSGRFEKICPEARSPGNPEVQALADFFSQQLHLKRTWKLQQLRIQFCYLIRNKLIALKMSCDQRKPKISLGTCFPMQVNILEMKTFKENMYNDFEIEPGFLAFL